MIFTILDLFFWIWIFPLFSVNNIIISYSVLLSWITIVINNTAKGHTEFDQSSVCNIFPASAINIRKRIVKKFNFKFQLSVQSCMTSIILLIINYSPSSVSVTCCMFTISLDFQFEFKVFETSNLQWRAKSKNTHLPSVTFLKILKNGLAAECHYNGQA